jgi:putative oxidoreductase
MAGASRPAPEEPSMRFTATPSQTVGLLPLRLVIALVFLMHGGQKLFVYGITGTTGAMQGMGIPLPHLSAIAVTMVELAGGLAILAGVFTRWAALLLVVDMTVVILVVKPHGGFFSPGGFEFELTLLAGALTLALLAPPRHRSRRPEVR